MYITLMMSIFNFYIYQLLIIIINLFIFDGL